jgi:curli biogenesis system outer membrane secretion channel CsgG
VWAERLPKNNREVLVKSRGVLVVLLGAGVLMTSCARVEKPRIREIPEETPQVAKALAQEQGRFLKRKVAIARFSNETKHGQSFLVDRNDDRIGKQAMDILSAKLAATGKFLMLERADIGKIDAELERGNVSRLNIASDQLIVGSVSEFGRKTVSDVGVFSRTKEQRAVAAVNVRLVDVRTGQIVYAEEASGEAFSEAGTVLGVGAKAAYDSTLDDRAISAAIGKLVNRLVENLLDKPWRSSLLSYDNGQYVMAGGASQGIVAGDIFEVVRRGKQVQNPQTGMLVELPGERLGTIRVVGLLGKTVNDELALCVVESGIVPRENLDDLIVQEAEGPAKGGAR